MRLLVFVIFFNIISFRIYCQVKTFQREYLEDIKRDSSLRKYCFVIDSSSLQIELFKEYSRGQLKFRCSSFSGVFDTVRENFYYNNGTLNYVLVHHNNNIFARGIVEEWSDTTLFCHGFVDKHVVSNKYISEKDRKVRIQFKQYSYDTTIVESVIKRDSIFYKKNGILQSIDIINASKAKEKSIFFIASKPMSYVNYDDRGRVVYENYCLLDEFLGDSIQVVREYNDTSKMGPFLTVRSSFYKGKNVNFTTKYYLNSLTDGFLFGLPVYSKKKEKKRLDDLIKVVQHCGFYLRVSDFN